MLRAVSRQAMTVVFASFTLDWLTDGKDPDPKA